MRFVFALILMVVALVAAYPGAVLLNQTLQIIPTDTITWFGDGSGNPISNTRVYIFSFTTASVFGILATLLLCSSGSPRE
jgi:hypothetical protein